MKLRKEIIKFHEEEEKKNSYRLTGTGYENIIGEFGVFTLNFSSTLSGIGKTIKISSYSASLDLGAYKNHYFEILEKEKEDRERANDLRKRILSSQDATELFKLGWRINIYEQLLANQFSI